MFDASSAKQDPRRSRTSEGLGGPDPKQVRLALRRILVSRGFAASDRMARFLKFAVERALTGRASDLKEYLIGTEVFDRAEDFDPRTDPIVRVEARRLRAKLAEYYDSEGRADPVRINFPKGRYAPEFTHAPAEVAPREAPRSGRRIAVLPFANLSTDPENEYFSEGLTQELTTVLSKVEGLLVIRTCAAGESRPTSPDLQYLREQLRVDAVIEGTVRRAGDRLRVTAQLVNAADGQVLWSDRFERKLEDIFAIQDDISRRIADTLRVKLRPSEKPEVPAAYNLYLKGRYFAGRRTQEGLLQAAMLFQQAIASDPDYALAHAGLADAYTLLNQYGMLAPKEVMPKALAAAKRARELDSTLAEAEVSMAFARTMYCWEWVEGVENYRRAIALDPACANARHWYATDCLSPLGYLDEAAEQMRIAMELDPLSSNIASSFGSLLVSRREYDAASEQFQRTIDADPHFYKAWMGFGRARVMQGAIDDGIRCFKHAGKLANSRLVALSALGHAFAVAGRREDALHCAEELIRVSQTRYVAATAIALIYVGLGETTAALDWLDRACEERSGPLIWLPIHPVYDPIRSESRFQEILKRIGLAHGRGLPT